MGVDIGAAAEPIVEDLPAEAPASGFEPLSGPRGVADDLKKLTGVSPAIEKKLNDLGIFHYWQIAELGADRCPQDRRGGRAARPRRRLDRAGERIRRGGVAHSVMAGLVLGASFFRAAQDVDVRAAPAA